MMRVIPVLFLSGLLASCAAKDVVRRAELPNQLAQTVPTELHPAFREGLAKLSTTEFDRADTGQRLLIRKNTYKELRAELLVASIMPRERMLAMAALREHIYMSPGARREIDEFIDRIAADAGLDGAAR